MGRAFEGIQMREWLGLYLRTSKSCFERVVSSSPVTQSKSQEPCVVVTLLGIGAGS